MEENGKNYCNTNVLCESYGGKREDFNMWQYCVKVMEENGKT